jgi:hypothetical protein
MVLRLPRLLAGASCHLGARGLRTTAPAFLDRKLLLGTSLATQPKTRFYATSNAPKLSPAKSESDEDSDDGRRQTFGGGGQAFGSGGMNLRDAALTTVVGLGMGECLSC